MRDLYIVETPLQLLCANEMIAQRGNGYRLLIRSTGLVHNDDQMQFAAKVLGLSGTDILVRPKYVGADFIWNSPVIVRVLAHRYGTLFLGSYFSRLIMTLSHAVVCKSRYILDDGIATFRAQMIMVEKERIYDLATFFDLNPLPGQAMIRHSFAHLRNRFPAERVEGGLFIGQPLVERDFLTARQYLDLVKSAQDRAKDRITYIPHRAEGEDFVHQVANLSGVDVVRPESCLELHLLMKRRAPKKIFSCISTGAFTLASIYKDAEVFLMIPKHLTVNLVPHLNQVLAYAQGISNMYISRLD